MGYSSVYADLASALTISFDTAKNKPAAHPGVEALAQSVREQAAKEPGIDLTAVTRAVEAATAEYHRRIDRALEGVADLEALKKSKGRRFVVVYWHNEACVTTEGIEYPECKDDKGKTLNYGVLVNSLAHSFACCHLTMAAFREWFTKQNKPYRIVYLDK